MRGELRNASVGTVASWSATTALDWFGGLADALAALKTWNASAWMGTISLAHLHAGRPGESMEYLHVVRVTDEMEKLLEVLEPVVARLFDEERQQP